jgi:aminoglycoside/choline kinase family phosphotransferase
VTDTVHLPACDSPEELTPEWLSAALAPAGFTTPVATVGVERVGTGQMGTSYRVTLGWSDPDAAAATGAPATVIAKMAAGTPESRTLISEGYRNEVGFYTEIAHTLAVRTPHCWSASATDDFTCFTLLLEDLAPATPGDQATGLTAEEAEQAAVNLAGLHGPRWSDPDLLEIPWLSRHTAETADFYGQILAGAIPTFVERFGGWMAPEDPATLDTVPAHLGAWLMTRPERFAVIHGDYRPDNLMFPAHGAGVSAVDWQTLAVGLPGRDIGYLLATSLDPGLRRAEEHRIVEAYRAALAEHAVEISADECFDDYRLGVVQGPLITVLGAVYANDPNPSSDAMFTAMITRSLQAIRDLDPFSLL